MKKTSISTMKGVRDYTGRSGELFNSLTTSFANLLDSHNYRPSFCSMIDPNDLYTSSLGTTSDIIQKEMFYLKTDDLVLRPEGTANLMYAIVRNGEHRNSKFPLKSYYMGPMFRYERPQLGRYRQFWQLGVEVLDIKQDLSQDLDMIIISKALVSSLNIQEKVTLQINNIGNDDDRQKFNEYLKSFFESNPNKLSLLSPDSRMRLQKNPLRILDSKDQRDQEVLNSLKQLNEFVSLESQKQFEKIQNSLTKFDIDFIVNPRLVRGLDYYNDLCYEYVVKDNAHKAQSAVIAGGRYDKLYKKIPVKVGFPIYGTGFALGIDRIIDLFQKETDTFREAFKSKRKTFGMILLIGEEDEFIPVQKASEELAELIKGHVQGVKFDKITSNSKNIGKRFDYFAERDIDECFIIGVNEVNTQKVVLRNLKEFSQKVIKINEILEVIKTE